MIARQGNIQAKKQLAKDIAGIQKDYDRAAGRPPAGGLAAI